MTRSSIRNMSRKVRFPMRKSNLCLLFFGAAVFFVIAMFCHAAYQRQAADRHIREMGDVVRTLGLTDLCLFTEARYTRHPSQADLYSAFQDHPNALEHFPTGSIAGPPKALRRLHGKLD